MNYTSEQLFSDWYKFFDGTATIETHAFRKEAITKIVTEEEIEFWLDVVRIALGIIPKTPTNNQTFIDAFKESDTTFPLINNDNLIKGLAAIALCFKLEDEEDEENNKISLAVINSTFLGQYEYDKNIPFVERAHAYYQASSSISRELEFEDDIKKINKIKKNVGVANAVINQADTIQLVQSVKTIINDNAIMSEELNVLWWLFGEYSKLSEKYFRQIDCKAMTILAAKELSDITKLPQGFYSAREILNRVLLASKSSKTPIKGISVFEAVNQIDEDMRKKIIQDKGDSISELTPCLLSIQKSIDMASGEDWSGAYKKQTTGDIKKTVGLIDIAFQVYREFLFVK
jgi:hypothetical protein